MLSDSEHNSSIKAKYVLQKQYEIQIPGESFETKIWFRSSSTIKHILLPLKKKRTYFTFHVI